jgi:hypothetical protein
LDQAVTSKHFSSMTGSPETRNIPRVTGGRIPVPRKGFGCIVALAALMGCAPSLKTDPPASADQANVGKDYWLTGAVHFCPVPNVSAKCQSLADGHLKTDGVEKDATVTPIGNLPSSESYYHVTFNDGRAGYIQASELIAHGTDIDPLKADCKRRGDPRIGMSAIQVEATCWGKPDSVNRSEKAGIIFDQYVYSNKNRFVYLRNGVVVSIQGIAARS